MKYVKCIEEENLHPYSVENIILVKLFDGRIATCNDEKKVIVYDPLNDYHCDVIIEDTDLYPSSLCQLENEKIVIASSNSILLGVVTNIKINSQIKKHMKKA